MKIFIKNENELWLKKEFWNINGLFKEKSSNTVFKEKFSYLVLYSL